ncbi:adenosylcobinamide-phosphate synthase CbiB [Lachnospiraceae bacterium 46-61]
MKQNILIVIIAFYMDILFGDPSNIPHPICGIGHIISKTESILRKYYCSTQLQKQKSGVLLVAIVIIISLSIPVLLLFLLRFLGQKAVLSTKVVICWYMLAMKSLKKESIAVYHALQKNDLQGARKAVSRIVGRDTQNLTEEGIIKATVETVAENTSDGVIAPLFYMTFFGTLGGVFYKAVNTMDSMVGYKNEKYIDFGKFAAKLDDIVNYIPSRISALLLCCCSFLLGYDGKNSFKIWKRDKRKHASPNSAQTESACAGALGIQLAGDAWYFGKRYQKEFIGDKKRNVEIEDIKRANHLLYASSVLAVIVFSVVGIIIDKCCKK